MVALPTKNPWIPGAKNVMSFGSNVAGECIIGVHTLSLNNCRNSQSGVVDEVVLGYLDVVGDPIPRNRVSNCKTLAFVFL